MLKTTARNEPDFEDSEPEKPGLLDVPVKLIRLRRDRPRRIFDQATVDRMMASLSMVGQLQPVGVRRNGARWILIFGYLRLYAAKCLGWETVRATEYPESGTPLIDLALWAGENLHSTPLALDEIAVMVNRLAEGGMSDPVIALALGKPVDWVTVMLSIARDPLARHMIEAGRLAEAEAWQAFIQLAPLHRKSLLDGTETITRKSCEQVQAQPATSPRKKQKSLFVNTQGQVDFEHGDKTGDKERTTNPLSSGSVGDGRDIFPGNDQR